MRADMLPLAQIKRLPRNPKLHDLEKIHQSIERFGFLERVVINETTGHMIAGHGRCEDLEMRKAAGGELPEGIEKNGKDWLVPVDYVSVLPGEENAAAIALNRLTETGGWDTKTLTELLSDLAASGADDPFRGIGYDADGLDAMLAEINETTLKDPSEKRNFGEKKLQIKPVLYIDQIRIFEQAIQATGLKNRGDAIIKICRSYLDEKRQFDFDTENILAEITSSGNP